MEYVGQSQVCHGAVSLLYEIQLCVRQEDEQGPHDEQQHVEHLYVQELFYVIQLLDVELVPILE